METNRDKFMKLVTGTDNGVTMRGVRHRIRYRKFYRVKNWVILNWLTLVDYIKSIK